MKDDVVIASSKAEATEPTGSTGCGGSCDCGDAEAAQYPELDARTIPHALRHATVLGALGSLMIGDGMILTAPHEPLPLLAQIDERWPGGFDMTDLQRGPDVWRLLFVRRASAAAA